MFGFGGGLIGLIELLLVIWGLVGILQSGADTGTKLIWILIILALPIIGFVLWYFIGPGEKALPVRR